MNPNMLISHTDHTHENEPDVQHEAQEIDLLGDISINSLAPALIPSPSPRTPRSVISDDSASRLSRKKTISACRHHWVKLGDTLKPTCQLCGYWFGTLVGCVGHCQVRICRACRWENRLAALMDDEF